MGGLFSNDRSNEGVEQLEHSDNNAYRYPPKCGNYFGSHFFMGGERFESTQPEAFLYGDNMDLNFLGNRPFPFPYPVTVGSEPSKALRGYVNIRKDTIRFFKIGGKEDEVATEEELEENESLPTFGVEFVIDADLPCTIIIHLLAKEETVGGEVRFSSKLGLSSPPFRLPAGYKQLFRTEGFEVAPWQLPDEPWSYRAGADLLPLAVHCDIEKEHLLTLEKRGDHILGPHGQVSLLSVEPSPTLSSPSLRLLKQKQIIDGLPYLLQEIYGLFQYNENDDVNDESEEEVNADCVVCMSEVRDTLILPCRHLCLCACCAESLRYQASACPICRAPFRALLQVRGLRRVIPLSAGLPPLGSASVARSASEEEQEPEEEEEEEEELPSPTTSSPSRNGTGLPNRTSPNQSNPAPHGYEAVSLLELLSSGWLSLSEPQSANPFTASSDAFLIRSGSRRLGDHEVCSISLESGSLCTRGSKKRTIKKRVRPTVSPTDINIKAPSLLTPRSVEGAEGGDCEVIELTPASRPYASSDQDCSRDHSPSPTEELEHGFRSVELHVPGIEVSDITISALSGSTEDLEALDPVSAVPRGLTTRSEEESSLSSAASGRALLSDKEQAVC